MGLVRLRTRYWALCHGQHLPINQNQALFSLLGTAFGGNGTTTFALPDLRGHTPIGTGGGGNPVGVRMGTETHTLTDAEAAHPHTVRVSERRATSGDPSAANPVFAGGSRAYSSAEPTSAMAPSAVSSVGASEPHPNMAPYAVLNAIICLAGIYPTRW